MAPNQDHQLPKIPINGMEPFPEFDPEYGVEEIEEWNKNQKPQPLTRQERIIKEYFDELKESGISHGRSGGPWNTQGGIFGGRDPNEIPPSPPDEERNGEASGNRPGDTPRASFAVGEGGAALTPERTEIPAQMRLLPQKNLTRDEADVLAAMLRPTPSEALVSPPENPKRYLHTPMTSPTREANKEHIPTSSGTDKDLPSPLRAPFSPNKMPLSQALKESSQAIAKTLQGITRKIVEGSTKKMSLAHRQAEFASKKPMMDVLTNPIMYTSLDGGDDEDGAMIPTLRNDSTPITRSVSIVESNDSKSAYHEGDAWDNKKIRGLTDIVRECIEFKVPIPSNRVEELHIIFMSLRNDIYPMTGYDVMDSHMDKLVDELIKNETLIHDDVLVRKAKEIKALWIKEFPAKLWDMSERRLNEMLRGTVKDLTKETDGREFVTGEEQRGGMLRGMSMVINKAGTGPIFTTPITTFAAARAQMEGGVAFTPGEWWPNKAAAARDGIITGRETIVTLNPTLGPTALTLSYGEEIDGPELNMTQYTITGGTYVREMIHFLKRRGPIRLLRGHKLKSRYAPVAGVRYEGLYDLSILEHMSAAKVANSYDRVQVGYVSEGDGTHRFTIILKRLDNQIAMQTVMLSPRPGDRDEWEVYQTWMRAGILSRLGQTKCMEWVLEEEKIAREQKDWIREQEERRLVGGGVPKFRVYTTVPRRPSHRKEE